MTRPKYDASWYQELVSKYTPLLVLYPEIPRGSTRILIPEWKTIDCPPLSHDYHPRDIRLVLENAAICSGIRSYQNGKAQDQLSHGKPPLVHRL